MCSHLPACPSAQSVFAYALRLVQVQPHAWVRLRHTPMAPPLSHPGTDWLVGNTPAGVANMVCAVSDALQRSLQIRQQVIDVLDADGQAHGAL